MIFQCLPVMPRFAYITISGIIIVESMETYKLKLLYILNEKTDFQKLFFSFYTYISALFKSASNIFKISS